MTESPVGPVGLKLTKSNGEQNVEAEGVQKDF